MLKVFSLKYKFQLVMIKYIISNERHLENFYKNYW